MQPGGGVDAQLRERLSAALLSPPGDAVALRRKVEAALLVPPEQPATEPQQQRVPQVVIDCDPGGDDVVALFWLLSMQHQQNCEVKAVTTTEGNVKAPLTFAAADKVLTLLSSVVQADIPVCAQTPPDARYGSPAERAASRERYAEVAVAGMAASEAMVNLDDAAHIHGRDGMGGLSAQLRSRNSYTAAAESYEVLIRALTESPHEITILATGPLTNLADAERRRPGVLKLAKRIIIMGGAVANEGNITPLAEFNFAFDPDAAHLVMEQAGLSDVILMPLDVTTELICTERLTEQVVGRRLMRDGSSGERPSTAPYKSSVEGCRLFFRDLADFMVETNMAFKETQGAAGFLVHDASTVAALFYPETLRFRRAQLCVVMDDESKSSGGHALGGFTFVDNRHAAKTSANCWIGCEIKASACLSIMVQDLKLLVNAIPRDQGMSHAHPSYTSLERAASPRGRDSATVEASACSGAPAAKKSRAS